MSSSTQTIHQLLNALQCGSCLVSTTGQITHANTALCNMFDLPTQQIINHNLLEFYSKPHDIKRIADILNSPLPTEREFHVPRPDGSNLPVVGASRPFQMPDQTTLRLFTLIDISQQKQAFSQVAQLTDTILAQALALKHRAADLEQRVEKRTADLAKANSQTILMLALASEAKDQDTGDHIQRIQHFTHQLAIELGLPPNQAHNLGQAAILHDVGKLHIPDNILQKPGPLTNAQRIIMQEHTTAGQRIIADTPFFALARQIARSHHEQWDGTGYPDQLKGPQIPLAARIVHVADVFDALASKRVYKPAWPLDDAADLIQKESATSFSPDIAAAFIRLYESGQIQTILKQHKNQ